MKRCNRCILPETVPGISFDSHGICRFCRDYKPIKYRGEKGLVDVFNTAQQKECAYDAIVPLSGGRDSSFVLYVAVSHGLRVLAINYDNEFVTQIAQKNMSNVCQTLNVKLIRYRSRHNLAGEIVRDSIINASYYGLQVLAQSFCGACSYGFRAVVYETAHRYGIPLILWGSSDIEKTSHMTRLGLQSHCSATKKLANKFRPVNIRSRLNMHRLRSEFPPCRSLIEDIRLEPPRIYPSGTEEISVFDYLPWDRKRLKETILQELNWQKPEGAATTWRSDCKLEPMVTYCFKNIFGCDKSAFGFHNMINEKQMTRAEALERENATIGDFTPELEQLLRDEIGVPEDTVARIRSFARPELWGE